MVGTWGVVIPPERVEAEFASIDTNGGGFILFDEFSKWAISKALDLEGDDDAGGADDLQGLKTSGYVGERGGFATSKGITQKEPLPRMWPSRHGGWGGPEVAR